MPRPLGVPLGVQRFVELFPVAMEWLLLSAVLAVGGAVSMCVFSMCVIEGPVYVASFFGVVAFAIFVSRSEAPTLGTPAALGVALIVVLSLWLQWRSRCRVPLVRSNGAYMRRILARVPSLHRPLVPPIYCWNASMQLIPFLIQCALAKRVVYDERQRIECHDGGHFYLNWLHPPGLASGSLTREILKSDATPTVMFLHGLM